MAASEGCCCFWFLKVNELKQAGTASLRADFMMFFGFTMFSVEASEKA